MKKILVPLVLALAACSSGGNDRVPVSEVLKVPASELSFDMLSDSTAALSVDLDDVGKLSGLTYSFIDNDDDIHIQKFTADSFSRDSRNGYIYSTIKDTHAIYAEMVDGAPINDTFKTEPFEGATQGTETIERMLVLAGAENKFEYVDFGYWRLIRGGKIGGFSSQVAEYQAFAGGYQKFNGVPNPVDDTLTFKGKAVGGAVYSSANSPLSRDSVGLVGEAEIVIDQSLGESLSIFFPGYYSLSYKDGSYQSVKNEGSPGNLEVPENWIQSGNRNGSAKTAYYGPEGREATGIFGFEACGGDCALSSSDRITITGSFGAKR
ncbi:MAG: hypothetical protein LBL52_00445 [Rickettsiales bacterium]|jgi:hypothetical protein|nr:hypothetical protein [Rickettsiales bacterium]